MTKAVKSLCDLVACYTPSQQPKSEKPVVEAPAVAATKSIIEVTGAAGSRFSSYVGVIYRVRLYALPDRELQQSAESIGASDVLLQADECGRRSVNRRRDAA